MSGSRDAEYCEYVATRLSSLRRLAVVLVFPAQLTGLTGQ